MAETGALAPQAVFFDFDGVLAESVAIKEQVFKELFAPYGDDIVTAVIELHRGLGAISRVIKIERIHRELLGRPLDRAELDDWAERYASAVEDQVVHCPEVAGTTLLLSDLAKRMPLFVVSGTPEDELRRIVAGRGWNGYFTGVYGSPRLKDEIVRHALAEFDLNAAECLFVGDTFTARATGVPFVGRRVHFRPNPFPPGTRIVDDMAELAGLLGVAA